MYFIGIYVSTTESALCILDGKGKIVREIKLPTDPEIIAHLLPPWGLQSSGSVWKRVGLPLGCLLGFSATAGQ